MNTYDSGQYQDRADALGKAVALRLSEGASSLPHDITERLKAARAQAVAQRKIVSLQTAAAVAVSGGEATLQFGEQDGGWWNRIASLLPLIALVAGLISITVLQDDYRTRELAEVDSELLTDDLPLVARAREELLAGADTSPARVRLRHVNGPLRWADSTARAVQTPDLRSSCARTIANDGSYVMRLRVGLNQSLKHWTFAACGLAMCAAHAQTVATAGASPAVPAASMAAATDTWASLSNSDKQALAPLEKSWSALSEGQRRKWVAIAKTYPALGTTEREKLHSRMAEWAALSPKDREAARLNFAQAKAINPSDRTANWEAYQALSPQEREKLAKGAKSKPVGAAVSVRPVAPEKLTPVPVTRHTPAEERSAVVSQRPLNRYTLLPQMPAPSASAAAAPGLATPSKP